MYLNGYKLIISFDPSYTNFGITIFYDKEVKYELKKYNYRVKNIHTIDLIQIAKEVVEDIYEYCKRYLEQTEQVCIICECPPPIEYSYHIIHLIDFIIMKFSKYDIYLYYPFIIRFHQGIYRKRYENMKMTGDRKWKKSDSINLFKSYITNVETKLKECINVEELLKKRLKSDICESFLYLLIFVDFYDEFKKYAKQITRMGGEHEGNE